MLHGFTKTASKLGELLKKSLNIYEEIILITLRKLSNIRYFLYAVSIYLICRVYTDDKLYQQFSILFMIFSSIQIFTEGLTLRSSVKLFFRNMVQSFLIVSSLIMISILAHGTKFLYENHEIIIRNIKGIVKIQKTGWKTAQIVMTLLSIPLSLASTLYAKYSYYKNLPDYRSNIELIHPFSGEIKKRKITEEKLALPVAQIIQLIICYLTNRNNFALLTSGVDLLNGYIDYIGHKKATFYWPMIFTGLLSVFISVAGFCQYVKTPITLSMNKNCF